jgi:hypothetical protein
MAIIKGVVLTGRGLGVTAGDFLVMLGDLIDSEGEFVTEECGLRLMRASGICWNTRVAIESSSCFSCLIAVALVYNGLTTDSLGFSWLATDIFDEVVVVDTGKEVIDGCL